LLPDASPVDLLGEKIAVLSAQLDAATYSLLEMIAEFDREEGWAGPIAPFRSCAHWLNWRTGLALGAAREKVRVAHALEQLPRIAESLKRGEISYSKVRAITRVATPALEDELLCFAKAGTASHVERLVRLYRNVKCEESPERDRLRHESRYLQLTTDEDGMVQVHGLLPAEVGVVLQKALEAASEKLYEATSKEEWAEISTSQARADGLGLVAEAALAGELEPASAGDRYQVVVHVDAGSETAWIEGWTGVPAETSRRLSCDASRVVMSHGSDGEILDVGRKTRTVPPAIRRAMRFRDGSCRFPGCTSAFCDAHHIEHWADGGRTSLDNLISLCRRHHRLVHEEGWRIAVAEDGSPAFYDCWGRLVPNAPAVKLSRVPPAKVIQKLLANKGTKIAPQDIPTWGGEPCSYGDAVWNLLLAEDVSAGTFQVRVRPDELPGRVPAGTSAADQKPCDRHVGRCQLEVEELSR
jgi:hypothetical protein